MNNKINTVKDIMENDLLINNITEDLEDFDENAIITYEVWAIGYSNIDTITDTEVYLGEFINPDRAVEYAKSLTVADILPHAFVDAGPDIVLDHFSVEVETVLEDDEENSMNIGTIYRRCLCIENIEDDEYTEVVPVTSKEYELLEDGSLEIDCEILKDFNKNDTVQIWFTDEDDKIILTYKIISKTTNNKYICEFIC